MGEELVLAKYLAEGYTLITKNFQYYQAGQQGRLGEIDLIMLKDKVVTLVEVKTRSNGRFGPAIGQITQKQVRGLYRAYDYFLTKFPKYRNCFARFEGAVVENGVVKVVKMTE